MYYVINYCFRQHCQHCFIVKMVFKRLNLYLNWLTLKNNPFLSFKMFKYMLFRGNIFWPQFLFSVLGICFSNKLLKGFHRDWWEKESVKHQRFVFKFYWFAIHLIVLFFCCKKKSKGKGKERKWHLESGTNCWNF